MLGISGPYRKVNNDSLPSAEQVADPFYVVKQAGSELYDCRRRVQNETVGIGAVRPIRSTGLGACWPRPMRTLTKQAKRN